MGRRRSKDVHPRARELSDAHRIRPRRNRTLRPPTLDRSRIDHETTGWPRTQTPEHFALGADHILGIEMSELRALHACRQRTGAEWKKEVRTALQYASDPSLGCGLVNCRLWVEGGPPQHRNLCEHEQDGARPRLVPKSVVSIPSGCRPPLSRSHFIVHDAHQAAGASPRSASH